MNTHETFVSLETAKLLKQAGFDWECRYYYDTWASPTLFDDKTGELKHELHTGTKGTDIVPKNYNARPDGAFASAPTQAVAQRWLREVKDKLIMLDFCTAEPNKFMAIITDTKFPVSSTAEVTKKWSDTYEAALEAGLQKCLTLLIEKQ